MSAAAGTARKPTLKQGVEPRHLEAAGKAMHAIRNAVDTPEDAQVVLSLCLIYLAKRFDINQDLLLRVLGNNIRLMNRQDFLTWALNGIHRHTESKLISLPNWMRRQPQAVTVEN